MPRSSPRPAGRRLTRAGLDAFLAALAETAMVSEAAARAGVPRASIYRRRASDRAFAKQWAAALETGLDRLRDEAVRRAMVGVEETVWYRGEAVGTARRYSDALLMFLLRAHQPQLYREPRGDAGKAAQAADKAATRAAAKHAREIEAAWQRGKDEAFDELLASIDGRTRSLVPSRDETVPVRDDGAGDADAAPDDASDAVAAPAAPPPVFDGPPGYAPAEEPAPAAPGGDARDPP